ncbi:MAG TPA: PhoPQ-activated protein PqaA family protein [Candidatus Binatia bacterium]|nr:PhoPQ-activated protein PqaA family protein [Candidatus Binatia bacterium]
MSVTRRLMTVLVLSVLGAGIIARRASADLQSYISKAEAEFRWTVAASDGHERSGDRIHEIRFVSQLWRGNRWQHQLQVYEPRTVAPNAVMFLWVTGGGATPDLISMGMELARKIRAPVAFLYHIPNQPLLEGELYEDDLIAETFVRYLKTGDETWPLLFPMVKSVVKAMDVLQEFGNKQWREPIRKFVVAGASKRGWTTWLTAAVDTRVGAIAPVVIDTLNMSAQMPRQLQAFGAYSSRLAPYSSRGLLPIPQSPEGRRLLNMVDPWAYRDRLTMPKLIINGTNDFYWTTDALNLYWGGIPGGKWVHYIPNAGHNLRREDRRGSDQLSDLTNGLAAFARYQMGGTPMPSLSWKHETINGKLRLNIAATPAPKAARLWVAQTATADFRNSKWNQQAVVFTNGRIIGEVAAPAKGHLAFFGELDYEIEGLPHHLSTQMRVTD